MTAVREDSWRWKIPAAWAAILIVSCLTQSYITVIDDARRGRITPFDWSFAVQATSHIVVAALVPAVYWMQRRFPVTRPRNIAVHAVALVVFSIVHTLGMALLRRLWFVDILGQPFHFPITLERLGYEFSKDIFTYFVMNAGVIAMDYLRQRQKPPGAAPVPAASAPPERFAVRKRGGSEVMVDVADIDWVEASGNYAILHVGGETFEIRSSLARLEGELDPKRFVRVHKSHLVNIARVAEVVPWVSGDWRLRLQDGAELNLSRRYRARFEALAPVKA
ncbi:MAG: LytTR family transcriptional regulator [Proteobacteria bacterium]|nr:LytTR family transcriptional regulator [Pseudomonadota bacterium]